MRYFVKIAWDNHIVQCFFAYGFTESRASVLSKITKEFKNTSLNLNYMYIHIFDNGEQGLIVDTKKEKYLISEEKKIRLIQAISLFKLQKLVTKPCLF